MAFQFLCPQGHLLQGEESQAGQQCKCPTCGTLFLIPHPAGPAVPSSSEPSPGPGGLGQAPPPAPPADPPSDSTAEEFPGIQTEAGPGRSAIGAAEPGVSLPTDGTPDVVHIACPSGHELETPREMLGQVAMCPYCQVQFELRWEESVEYRRRKAEELERKQAKVARMWLQWSITAAVLVVLGLILMIVISKAG